MQDIRAGVTPSRANDAQNPPPILARRGSQGSRPVFFHSCGPGLPTLRPSRAFCYQGLPVGFVFPRPLRTPSPSSLPFTPCDDPVALRGRRRRHQRDRGSCPHQQRQRRMTAADPHDQLPRMLHNTTISFWQGEATVAVAGERKGGDSAEYQGAYFGATDGGSPSVAVFYPRPNPSSHPCPDTPATRPAPSSPIPSSALKHSIFMIPQANEYYRLLGGGSGMQGCDGSS